MSVCLLRYGVSTEEEQRVSDKGYAYSGCTLEQISVHAPTGGRASATLYTLVESLRSVRVKAR